jgi:hypothetical protein
VDDDTWETRSVAVVVVALVIMMMMLLFIVNAFCDASLYCISDMKFNFLRALIVLVE